MTIEASVNTNYDAMSVAPEEIAENIWRSMYYSLIAQIRDHGLTSYNKVAIDRNKGVARMDNGAEASYVDYGVLVSFDVSAAYYDYKPGTSETYGYGDRNSRNQLQFLFFGNTTTFSRLTPFGEPVSGKTPWVFQGSHDSCWEVRDHTQLNLAQQITEKVISHVPEKARRELGKGAVSWNVFPGGAGNSFIQEVFVFSKYLEYGQYEELAIIPAGYCHRMGGDRPYQVLTQEGA